MTYLFLHLGRLRGIPTFLLTVHDTLIEILSRYR